MASKSFTLESSINFEYENGGPLNDKQRKIIIKHYANKYNQARTRENARALIEEMGKQQERDVFEISFATYFGISRPYSADAAGRDIFRRSQEHRQKTETNTDDNTR